MNSNKIINIFITLFVFASMVGHNFIVASFGYNAGILTFLISLAISFFTLMNMVQRFIASTPKLRKDVEKELQEFKSKTGKYSQEAK